MKKPICKLCHTEIERDEFSGVVSVKPSWKDGMYHYKCHPDYETLNTFVWETGLNEIV